MVTKSAERGSVIGTLSSRDFFTKARHLFITHLGLLKYSPCTRRKNPCGYTWNRHGETKHEITGRVRVSSRFAIEFLPARRAENVQLTTPLSRNERIDRRTVVPSRYERITGETVENEPTG